MWDRVSISMSFRFLSGITILPKVLFHLTPLFYFPPKIIGLENLLQHTYVGQHKKHWTVQLSHRVVDDISFCITNGSVTLILETDTPKKNLSRIIEKLYYGSSLVWCFQASHSY